MHNRILDTIIVENNKRDLDRLVKRLEAFPGRFNITGIRTYNDARAALLSKKFDLAIFDVRLNDSKNCFQLIQEVGNSQFKICAITSHKDEGKLSQVYLAKNPIWFPKIHTEEKILIFIKQLNERMDELEVELDKEPLKTFAISGTGRMQFPILIDNIYSIQSDNKVTYFYYFDNNDHQFKRQPSNENLNSVLQRLTKVSAVFLQCHKSWIVNRQKIEKLGDATELGGEGTVYISHEKCKSVPLGGVYKDDIERALNIKPKPSQMKP